MNAIEQLRAKLLAAQSLINEATALIETIAVTSPVCSRRAGAPLAQAIITTVANFYATDRAAILSRNRGSNRVATARQVAIYYVRTYSDFTTIEIGHIFERNHTSITYSVKVVEDRLSVDRSFGEDILALSPQIRMLVTPADNQILHLHATA